MKAHLCALLATLAMPLHGAVKVSPDRIVRVPNADRPGTAWAVRVADGSLLMTGQFFPSDVSRDPRGQTEQMLDQLDRALVRAGSGLRQVLRLNVYVTSAAITPAVDATLSARFADLPVAVSVMCTPLSLAGAVVACDAVAALTSADSAVKIQDGIAIVPAGVKVFVSGQAKRGPDFGASIKLTMDGLHEALAHLTLTKTNVVHVKAFISPFTNFESAKMEIEKSFAGAPIPPIVIAAWQTGSPTEIELIAAAPTLPVAPNDAVTFHSLPGLSTSPYFSRIATVGAGSPLIFLAGIDGGESGNPRDQWLSVFQRLAFVLRETGSSFRHMAKATYFLADPKAREALGEIRGVYFDPTRPPAASAVDVASIGRPGRLVGLDIIAVPAKSPPAPPAPGKK